MHNRDHLEEAEKFIAQVIKLVISIAVIGFGIGVCFLLLALVLFARYVFGL